MTDENMLALTAQSTRRSDTQGAAESRRRVNERRQHDAAPRPTLEEAKRIVGPLLEGERDAPHPRGVDVAAQWWQHRHAPTLDRYVMQAAADPDIWHALDEMVSRLALDGTRLNGVLRDWFIGVRAGARPCPARRPGPDPSVRAERNERIAEAVDMLVAVGMPRSRRHTKDKAQETDGRKRESACDVVSAVLVDYGVNICYSTVESAWRRPRQAKHPPVADPSPRPNHHLQGFRAKAKTR